ncbi:MAG: sarcosine oxidase subunit gamma [Roseicyclus sp.]|nr:sarcosine oxidase subunit gamma [Roseicyclus sp.]
MSEAVSALQGAESDGIVRVSEGGLRGMVSLKADLNAATGKAVKAVTGQALPEVRGISEGDMSVAWMAPDEVLILCDHGAADGVVAGLAGKLGAAHHLAVNVSDARVLFTLRGAAVKDILGKLTPADLSALAPGEMRRTRVAQVAAAIWLSDAQTAHVICFRSVAQYMFDLLSNAARPGSDVGYHWRIPLTF